MRDTDTYYNLHDGDPISLVIGQWAQLERKVWDSSMPVWYSVAELMPYRDYDRPIVPKLEASMLHDGWREDDPGIVIVSREGHAYLGEGNHRLAIARKHNLPVPVRFVFQQRSKKPLEMRLAEPPLIDVDVLSRVDPAELDRYTQTGRVPRGCVLEHDAYQSRDRLKLDPQEPPPRRKRKPRRPRTALEELENEVAVQELLDLLTRGRGDED